MTSSQPTKGNTMDKTKFAAAILATTFAGGLTVIGAKVTAKCLADALNEIIVAIND